MYKQTWYSSINNSNRLGMYFPYKHDFDLENYLDFIEDKKFRFALTKFRLASHDLANQRMRYENIDRSEWLYSYCNGNFVESEYHFLLVCPFYSELQQRYINLTTANGKCLTSFDDLMCKRNKNVVLNLSKFICVAFKSRQMSN